MARELTLRHVQILLVLAEAPRHGYAISKELEARTGGSVKLKPGSMYRALHQLLAAGWIKEITESDPQDERRRKYRVTPRGNRALRNALNDFRDLIATAERSGIVAAEAKS